MSTYCGLGAVVGGRYYFVYETTTGDAHFASIDAATFLAASLIDHGTLQSPGVRVQRMVLWRPIITVFERIYFAFETGTAVNTYFDLITSTLVSDAITRRGVTTDGTLLYELLQESGGQHVLRSRTLLGATAVIGTQPENTVPASIGPCIGYAGNRIWSIWRSGTNGDTHTLRMFYLIDDPHFFDDQMPEIFQTSAISEDRTTGRLILIQQLQPQVSAFGVIQIYPIRLRMFESPHAPTASVFEASWDDQLIDGALTITDENAGESALLTRVTWTMHPVSIGSPIVVWVGSFNGQAISPQNPFFFQDTATNFNFGKPTYVPQQLIAEGFRVGYSTDLAAYPCPIATPGATGVGATVDADGVATFGPATNRSVTPIATIPQQVWWTTIAPSVAITAILQPHPTNPALELTTPGGIAGLSSLQIVGTPFLKDAEVTVEIVSEDVFEDGDELRKRYGENDLGITSEYIGDMALLRMVGLELLRLYGKPQVQLPGIQIMPNWAIGMEDVITVKESTTGVQAKLQVVGLSQRFAVSGRSLTVGTSPRLLTIATVSTEGTGQGTVTPLPGPPVAE
jgi:hypothetical protein